MAEKFDKILLEKALTLLNDLLEFNHSEPVNIIICGGSALIATGFVSRTTKDIDILAFMKEAPDGSYEIIEATSLPMHVAECASQIAHDLSLDKKWLNCGPSDLIKYGLPAGFKERLYSIKFGNVLTVHYIGRLDQIYFKVYAAVDSGAPGRHTDDLHALNPNEEEIELAAKWAMTHDPSEGFRQTLKQMLRLLDYESISERI